MITLSVGDFGAGGFSPDGAAIIYNDIEHRLARAPLSGGTPMIVQAGPIRSIDAISPDGAWAIYSTNIDANSSYRDLYLTSLDSASPVPLSLRQQTDGLLLGPGFSPDSKFALYATSVDSDGNGVFSVQPVGGGAARTLAMLDYYWLTLDGSRLLYTDHLKEMDANGFPDGIADIELIDLASAAAPTTLVTGAKPQVFLAADKKSIVYSLPAGTARPGVYVMRLPDR